MRGLVAVAAANCASNSLMRICSGVSTGCGWVWTGAVTGAVTGGGVAGWAAG